MCHFLCSPFAENDEWIKSIFHLSFFLIFRNSGGFPPFCVCALSECSVFHSHLVEKECSVAKAGKARWRWMWVGERQQQRARMWKNFQELTSSGNRLLPTSWLFNSLSPFLTFCCHYFPIVQIDTSTCACFKNCSSGRRVVDEWICAES